MDNLYAKFHINSNASDEEIRKVYDALIKKYTSSSYKGSQETAEKNILKAKKIYNILSDAKLRAEHDKANGISTSNPYIYEKQSKADTNTTAKTSETKSGTVKTTSAKSTKTGTAKAGTNSATKTTAKTADKTTTKTTSKTTTKTTSKTTANTKTKSQTLDVTVTKEQLAYTLLTEKQRQKLAADIKKLEKMISALSDNDAHLTHEELEKQNADYDKKLKKLQKKLAKDEKERLKKEIVSYDEYLKVFKGNSPIKTNSAPVKTVEIEAVDITIIPEGMDIPVEAVKETAATVANSASADTDTNVDTVIEVVPPLEPNDFSSIFLINDEPPKKTKGKKSKKSTTAEVVTQEIGIVETTELEATDTVNADSATEDLQSEPDKPKDKAKDKKSKNKTDNSESKAVDSDDSDTIQPNAKQAVLTEQAPDKNQAELESQDYGTKTSPKQEKQAAAKSPAPAYSDTAQKRTAQKSMPADISKKRMPRPFWLLINVLVCLIVGVSAYIATDGIYGGSFLGDIFTKTYSLEYSASEGGYIDGSTNQSVKEGSSGEGVYARANEGYIFVGWSDGQTSLMRTDTNVGQNISVVANFVKGIKVEYTAGENGYILGETTQYVLSGGDAKEVSAEGFNGYAFDYWSGQKDGGDYTDENAVREDKNITAAISLTAHFTQGIMLIYKAETGGVIIGRATQAVKAGFDGQTVVAEAESGFIFVGWSDDPNGTIGAERTDKSVQNDMIVYALFAPVHTLKYEAKTGGKINGITTQTIQKDTDGNEVEAVAESGYKFISWSDGDTSPIRKDTADNDKNIEAIFKKFFVLSYNIEVISDIVPTEGFSISQIEPQDVFIGDNALDATAVCEVAGYIFDYWKINGVRDSQNTTALRTDSNIQNDMVITAVFTKVLTVTYSVELLDSLYPGEIVGNAIQPTNYGKSTATITAQTINSEKYIFSHWIVNGEPDNNNPAARTDNNITADMHIVAVFARLYKAIYTANDTNGGKIDGEHTQLILEGTYTTAVEAVAKEGYKFSEWSDGVSSPTRTDIADGDKTITAIFKQYFVVNYQISLVPAISGDYYIDGTARQEIIIGENAESITAVCNVDNYVFVGWQVNNTTDNINTSSTRTDTNITADMNIVAVFTRLYKITYTANDVSGGKIEGEVTQIILNAAYTTQVEAVAKEGYKFTGWSDGVSSPTRTDIADGDKTITAIFKQYFVLNYSISLEPAILGDYYIDGVARQEVIISENAKSITAVCNLDNYVFVSWQVNGTTDTANTLSTRTDTNITADMNIVAVFIKEYTVSYTASTGGKISSNTQTKTELTYKILHGKSVTEITAITDNDKKYEFDYWLVDGQKDTANTTATRTDTSITSNKTIEAVFIELYKVTYKASTGGTISDGTDSGTELIYYIRKGNDAPKITASPTNTNEYVFDYWQDGDDTSNKTDYRTDTSITSDKTITAVFAKLHKVEYTVGTGGTLSDGTTAKTTFTYYIKHGESAPTITAVADKIDDTPIYEFAKWYKLVEDKEESATNENSEQRQDQNITAPITYIAKFLYLGNGTEDYPFGIHTPAHLDKINNNPNSNFILCADIDLDKISFTPLCPTGFNGTLDGKGFSIKNMTITISSDYVGLFAKLNSGAVVKNLSFENATITVTSDFSATHVGILAGFSQADLIENVHVRSDSKIIVKSSPSINGYTYYIGGIVGATDSDDIISIDNCSSVAEITSELDTNRRATEYIGGIVGDSYNTSITNCYVESNIYLTFDSTSSTTYIGLIVGDSINSIISDIKPDSKLVFDDEDNRQQIVKNLP